MVDAVGVSGHKRAPMANTSPTNASLEDTESGDYCRICRGEGTSEQPLFHPCKCSGSIKFVHQECLMEWLVHSQKKYCELCKTSFRFTKLYDHSMPERLPLGLFLQQLVLHAGRRIARWLRYVLVVFVWICWLPWSIRQVWRGLFWLADGSWMTPKDLHRLVITASETGNSTSFSSIVPTVVAAGRSTEINSIQPLPWNSALSFFEVFTGDALLKGLLRLISYKAFPNQTLVSETNASNSTAVLSASLPAAISNKTRSSILSNVQSLNSFTKHPVLNNALIDLLEGQIICLAVITAFILVFLIREWVVNQQPVHLMPDPDQVDVPVPQANQDVNVRQRGGRRRRMAIRLPLDPNAQNEPRAPDMARRPHAMLRPRRAATEDNIGIILNNTQSDNMPPAPRRADSLQMPTRQGSFEIASDANAHTTSLDQISPIEVRDLTSPPLQRGILDDVVDIRRNIEETVSRHTQEAQENQETHKAQEAAEDEEADYAQQYEEHLANRSALEMRLDEEYEEWTRLREDISQGNDTLEDAIAQGRINDSSFDPPPSSGGEAASDPLSQMTDVERREWISSIIHRELAPQQPHVGENVNTTASDDEWADISSVAETTAQANRASDDVEDYTAEEPRDARPQLNDTSPPVTVEQIQQDRSGIIDRITMWMWDTEQYTLHQDPTALPRPEAEEHPAQAHFVRAPREPQPRPVEIPAPILEPNIQWGVDVNDPNAADDLEDVEGILELIGMEGPISSMLQNFVFSVLLVSLTLAVSVWCPYIWGKIALLVMSNPIGVFLKAPLFFISRVADVLVDLMLLVVGLLGYVLTNFTRAMTSFVTPYVPFLTKVLSLESIQQMTISLSQRSSLRLERAFSGTVIYLRPDLPTFSMQSLHVLRVLRRASFQAASALAGDLMSTITRAELSWQQTGVFALPLVFVHELTSFPKAFASMIGKSSMWLQALSADLKMPIMNDPANIDYSLIQWTIKDRAAATIAGYVLAILVACAYLQVARRVSNLRPDEKLGGLLANSLRQAGGVVKVIVIIGIEMIVFPLYCGCLVDVALLPLFTGASISSRLAFVAEAPITGLFVHWFLGTCYMFHFALFVSMCRKILRRGVLYFIRDPEDPTFHPVRDVLERPVMVQLSKISFSACVYGGLVMLCLGSVIWALSNVSGIFPIEWTTDEPRLAFPVDIIFFNFFLPFILKRAEPSKRVSVVYEWWFRTCADRLKLANFLFAESPIEKATQTEIESGAETRIASGTESPSAEIDRKDADMTLPIDANAPEFEGRWVRAPASDAVRIPKGTKVFLEIDENNNRIDGKPDHDEGLHGKNNERFEKIFIPHQFRLRICGFVFLVWLFAASTGAVLAVGPLLTGRHIIKVAADLEKAPNDLYAFTVGIHLWALFGYAGIFFFDNRYHLKAWSSGSALNIGPSLSRLSSVLRQTMGFVYVLSSFGIVIPTLLSLLVELYVHAPFYNYVITSKIFERAFPRESYKVPEGNASIPTIYMVQAWTLGILYLRVLLRIVTTYPNRDTRAAVAIKLIFSDGVFLPNVRLATRAFILPVVVSSLFLLAAPLGLAKVVILAAGFKEPFMVAKVYRNSYATILAIVIDLYLAYRLRKKIQGWQVDVRDQVYLRGERLHNFSDPLGLSPPTQATNGAEEVNVMIVNPEVPVQQLNGALAT